MDYRYFEPTYYPRHTAYQPQYVPPNRPTSDYLPQLSRSSSTGTHYYNQDYYTPVTSRRRRNKIDRFVYEDEDGEPMNDLEVIAKKNAAKNERQSKIVYPDKIKENYYTPAAAAETMDDSEVVYPNTTSSVSSFDSTLVGSESSTTNHPHNKKASTEPSEQPTNDGKESSEEVITTVEPAATNKKKKRSLFSCLFKKIVSAPPIPSPHHSPLLPPLPTPSFSTPPTPVLSPDNNQQQQQQAGGVNSVSSSTTSSPFEEISSSDGTWVFSYPTLVPVTPTVWIQFDLENQKRIADHVRSKLPVVQFMDSHIGAGTVLCTVSLLQKACFIPFGNQFTRLELSYIPPRC
ncbi:hypothetical protein BD770DRAFT_425151 [Pilaira anomala]|nr:hypothetical protein BD770DRAFT_425151 [Pilaira anomala]